MAKHVYNGWEFPSAAAAAPNARFLKIIASPEVSGYEKATVLFSHIPPGSSTGMHTHADSDEIIYFVGRGEGIINGEKIKLETDSVMIAPKGVEHDCRNTSQTETLKLFCVFIPSLKPSGLMEELAGKTKEYLKNNG